MERQDRQEQMTVVPKVTERERIEAEMAKPWVKRQAGKPALPADFGLFDVSGRNQEELF